MKRLLTCVLSVLLSTVVVVSVSYAQSCYDNSVPELISSEGVNNYPQINDRGEIVWVSNGASGIDPARGVYYYDSSAEVPASERISIDHSAYTYYYTPRINENGHVVWSFRSGSGSPPRHIYLYDPYADPTADPPEEPIRPLSLSGFDNYEPRINNNGDVVWQGHDGNDHEIFFYDFSADKTIQITDDADDVLFPELNDNGYIVWKGWDGESWEIFLYNSSDKRAVPEPITNYQGPYYYSYNAPKINNDGYVVYYGGYTAGISNVFLYNIETGQEETLSDNITSAYDPQISDKTLSNGGYVVWTNNDIFLNDFEDINIGTTTQITSDSYPDMLPQINDNGDAVWGKVLTGAEVFFYDSSAETTTQITNNGQSNSDPQVNNNGYIVWRQYSNSGVYLLKPSAVEMKHDGTDQDCNGYDLTIDILTAEYSSADDTLTVEATSSLGQDANLILDTFGLPMKWLKNKQLWAITVEPAGGDPIEVVVCGIEGCETAPTTGGGPADPEICDDGIDNDGDGKIDCADPDCNGDPNCPVEPEICNDGIDNDGDGKVDCADKKDCGKDPAC